MTTSCGVIFALSLLWWSGVSATGEAGAAADTSASSAVGMLAVDAVWEGGTVTPTTGVSYTFTGLDTSLYTYTLTVQVYETDYDGTTENVDGIYAGSTTLSSYCNPGVQSGGSFYTCVSSQDVTSAISSTSLVVRTTATSDVNCCEYLSYDLYVKYTLSRTAISSSQTTVVWDGGTNYPTSGVSYTFTGLDTSSYTYDLSVEVYATDFASSNEYVNGIYAGSTILSSNCNPGVDSGGYYHTCVSSQDVTSAISSTSLLVQTTATSSVDCCSYNGYYLYVKYTLSRTAVSSAVAVWDGGTNSPTTGVSYTFTGLSPLSKNYILTVEVYATDFLDSTEYVDGIYAGSTTLSTNCNPGVDSGGYYHTCVSSQDVTSAISSTSLVVRTTATSAVNCCSFNGYYLYVKYTLTAVTAPVVLLGGTNSPTSGVSTTFTGLSTSSYSYYLTVEVYATDFASSNEYVNGIYAGSTTLSTNCNPGVDSGGYYHTCVSSQDVTSAISSTSLLVRTTATSSVDCCSYNGYYLYVKYTLSAGVPTSSAAMTWDGGTNYPTSGIIHTFTGLSTSSYSYYLTVEVYATDFASSSEYVNGIYAGTTTLSTYCNPGLDSGGYYHTCVSSQDVTSSINSGSLIVSAYATSSVDAYAYNGYYFYVKYTLSTSTAGSSSLSWEGGTNSPTSGVSHTFYSLDTSSYTYTLIVDVYATDFYSSTEYVSKIEADYTTLTSYCNPGVDNGGYFHTCYSGDVTYAIVGTSLDVKAYATSSVNLYSYLGYYFYVRYTLQETSASNSNNDDDGATVVVVATVVPIVVCCAAAGLVLFFFMMKKNEKVGDGSQSQSSVKSGGTQVQVSPTPTFPQPDRGPSTTVTYVQPTSGVDYQAPVKEGAGVQPQQLQQQQHVQQPQQQQQPIYQQPQQQQQQPIYQQPQQQQQQQQQPIYQQPQQQPNFQPAVAQAVEIHPPTVQPVTIIPTIRASALHPQ